MEPLRITVSGTRNRTHAIYVASWIRHILQDEQTEATVVERNCGGRLREEFEREDGLLRSISGATWVAAHPTQRGAHYFVSIGSPGIKTWFRFRVSPSAWPLHTVVVDEGIGSYGSVATRRSAMRREGSREPWATVRAWATALSRRVLPDESWRLYYRSDDGWKLDDRVAAEFRMASAAPARGKVVFFLTQPWVENHLVDSDAYVEHLRRVRDAAESAGFQFAVRAHPTEDTRRYDEFGPAQSLGPVELDAQVLAAHCVLGETSTALLNLAAIHGVPAARVIGPLADIAEIALSPDQEALFQRFVPVSVTVEQLPSVIGGQ